ncbi:MULTISPECIES: hypothetical protein [Arthrobacter]|uniref:Response receiver domain-containing protein n=2 Tax=Arthrobacter TaxID=1663 RepID=A0ABU9KNZ7_9MICC|nr:hypothetical protein [Arthrobacter sp. YJM1]MDP5228547.1 hypothetical protein [Arthrobacter sp. YJM1]
MTGEPTSGPSPKELTRDLLAALGIVRVISVDDDHAQEAHQSKEDVLGAIRAGTIDIVLAARVVLPDEEDGDAANLSTDEVRDLVDESWDELEDQARIVLTQAALRASSAEEGAVVTQSPAVSGNNAALLALPEIFADVAEFLPMGLNEWRSSGQVLLDDSKPTLLIFDRSFEREGGSATGGDDLVRGVLSRTDREHVYVGLLTHTASDLGREAEIAAQISQGLDSTRPVIVVAKNRLQDESFPEALRVVLFASEIEAFREHLIRSFSQATDTAISHFRRIEKYLLFASIEAARAEGAYEPDHATRIASAFARKTLARSLRDGDFIADVMTRLRRAGAVRLYLDGASKPAALAEVAWDEHFETGELLSALAMPLEVGDIFKIHDLHGVGKSKGADRYYVLLAQECDLSVRADGKRSNDLTRVVLTELRQTVHNEEGLPAPLKENQAEFGPLQRDSSSPWRVQFARQIVVPMLALDACVVSGTGRAVISTEGKAPSALPESWKARFTRMQAEVKSLIGSYRGMETMLSSVEGSADQVRLATKHVTAAVLGTATKHKDGLTAKIDVQNSRVEFGIERYARLADGSARGLLSLLLQHQSRPAFDGKLFYEAGA